MSLASMNHQSQFHKVPQQNINQSQARLSSQRLGDNETKQDSLRASPKTVERRTTFTPNSIHHERTVPTSDDREIKHRNRFLNVRASHQSFGVS